MVTTQEAGRRVSAVLLAACLLSVTTLSAEKVSTGDAKTDNVIVEMQDKLKAVETCRAQVTTLLTMGEDVYTIKDEASYRVPGKFRLERTIADQMRQSIVADGSLLWVHDHAENVVTRANMSRVYKATSLEADGDQPDLTRPFRGIEWESIRYLKAEALGTDLCRAFEATPKPISLFADLPVTPARVRFLVHPEDGLLRKLQYLGAGGEEILSHLFEQVEVNPKVGDKVFEFVVPSRALVMDSTDDTIDLLKAAQERTKQKQ